MSYNPYFNIKGENSNIANLSSTNESTYILLIANDNTKINENCNIITNNNNAALIGANIIDESSDNHEAFIGVRENDKNAIVAKFNKDNILFKVDAIFEENILPNTNENFDIGSLEKKWNNIFAKKFIGDGSELTNIRLDNNTTDDLKETDNNKYYKTKYFDNDLNNRLINRRSTDNNTINLDNIEQGEINKTIVNGYYSGTLTVDNIIINNYDENDNGFNIVYDINVTNTDQILEGTTNLYYTDDRVINIVNNSNNELFENIENIITL